MSKKNQKSALISVFNKEGIDKIARKLSELNINIISTGGTEKYLNGIGINTEKVEKLTDYPSIFGGRVKTLHPKIFGGILYRRDSNNDNDEKDKFDIPEIDFIIVDLYPFEDTVNDSKSHQEIIEKIDIGGVSLIRAAAKNFNDVVCVSSTHQYEKFINDLNENKGDFSLEQKKDYALNAFSVSSNYDTLIAEYFKNGKLNIKKSLRYGENPHQKAYFLGNLDEVFDKLNGKELSYNNLLDIDSAVNIIAEYWNDKPTFAILKHNNACGLSTRENIYDAYEAALEGDPVSAFGGVLISNSNIDLKTSEKINNLFFEIIISPKYSKESLEILKSKKNRIILIQKKNISRKFISRDVLNGSLKQDFDDLTNDYKSWTLVTKKDLNNSQIQDLDFANKVVKHSKSNAIVLVKNKQMLSSGVGQTSRVDALKFAIEKAKTFNFDLKGSMMASDAFFPFPDCIEIASEAGIEGVVQPGGSIKDDLSINACDKLKISMYLTGTRHFYH